MAFDEAKIGELIGTVSGLANSTKRIEESQDTMRREFLDVFSEMRRDVKEMAVQTKDSAEKLADAVTQHLKDDNAIHVQVVSLLEWRQGNGNEGAEKRVGTLWDERNKNVGILSASRLIGGGIWAIIAVSAGFGLEHLFK